jgi:hypothetical protein
MDSIDLLPGLMKRVVLEQALWKWFALVLPILAVVGLVVGVYRLPRRRKAASPALAMHAA